MRIILLHILCLASYSVCLSQQGFDNRVYQLLDTSLRKMTMQRKDLLLNWDAVTIDNHRSTLQKNLFDNPMAMGNIVDTHAKAFSNYTYLTADAWFSLLLKDAGIGTYQPQYLVDNITAAKLDILLGVQLDTLTNLTTAFVIRQYTGPLIAAIKGMEKPRDLMMKDPVIVNQADSMIMLSQEGETANVYELKASEIAGQIAAKDFFSRASSPIEIISNGLSLARTYEELITISKGMHTTYKESLQPIQIPTKYGIIAIGSYGDDIYKGDYAFILDPGGNDTYIMTSGRDHALKRSAQCIIDLAGNDTYLGEDYSLASGFFGIGLLFDVQGNDLYKSGNFSLASGVFGIGYLHDFEGMDTYRSGTNAQGMGSFGIGLLIDDSGNDVYTVDAHGQAFGATEGAGILADRSGNDMYVCASPFQDFLRYDAHYESFAQGAALGYRPIASGGIALLMDLRGNDSYLADIYAQGTGYWYAFGALYDADGEDRYQAYQYAQGSGVHLAQGLLWDKRGDDVYTSHGVSQGCGHDIATGLLLDEAGNDSYQAESLSLGAGNANAISLLLELTGDDCYIARNTSNTMGYSDFRRNYGMIGIFADGGGKDMYGNSEKNNTNTLQSHYGLFIDDELLTEAIINNNNIDKQGSKEPLSFNIDSLFVQASAAPQKYQYNVDPARKAIIARGVESLGFLLSKLRTESPRERLALDNILPKLYESFPDTVSTLLIESINSPIFEVQTFAIGLCGRLKIKKALEKICEYSTDSDWRIRALCAQQLGEIGDTSIIIVDTLIYALKDAHINVRARAAYSLGLLMPFNVKQLLQTVLNKQEYQLIRNSAIQGLARSKKVSSYQLQQFFGTSTSKEIKMFVAPIVLAKDSTVQVKEMVEICCSQGIEIRALLYKMIKKEFEEKKELFWKETIKGIKKKEKDKVLISIFK